VLVLFVTPSWCFVVVVLLLIPDPEGKRFKQHARCDALPCRNAGRRCRSAAIHRLGEIVAGPSDEVSFLTRACVSYSIAGVIVADPSAQQLALLRPGNFLLLAPCASKPDQFGEEHCPFPSVLPFDGLHNSAAAAICDIERKLPCRGLARRHTPLFVTASGKPYSYALLNRRLLQLVHAIFGPGVADTISWHSIRIGLACALHAAGCPDPAIQLICRWASPESLKLYRLLGTSSHIAWCDRAAAASFDAIQVTNIPRLDNSLDYAALAAPAPASLARAQETALAAASSAIPPPPLVAAGARIEVLWTELARYFVGSVTSHKFHTQDDGSRVRLSRVAYDAVDAWRALSLWHNLAEETWRPARS
jgi:hypothetical protein